jgi:hypothetical protein
MRRPELLSTLNEDSTAIEACSIRVVDEVEEANTCGWTSAAETKVAISHLLSFLGGYWWSS